MFRYVNSAAWAAPGSFMKSYSKGYTSTTWVFDLHANPHDFDAPYVSSAAYNFSRKVFSSNTAHLSVVLLWLSGMHFHGVYFSNFSSWLKDPLHVCPSAQSVWEVLGQDSLNSDLGGYFQGIYITSGIFHLWRSSGVFEIAQLKELSLSLQLASLLSLVSAYVHMNYAAFPSARSSTKLRALSSHHVCLLLGLGSISWSGHQVHVAIPLNALLDAGVEPSLLPSPNELISDALLSRLYPTFGTSYLPDFSWSLPTGASLIKALSETNPQSGSLYLGVIAAHHFYVGVSLVLAGCLLLTTRSRGILKLVLGSRNSRSYLGHLSLSLSLGLSGSLSIVSAHHLTSMPVYPFLAADYPTQLSAFVHHMWIGMFLLVGSSCHAAIHIIRDYYSPGGSSTSAYTYLLIGHRDAIIAHLVWVTIFLGTHAFGIYIHNDTLQALGRAEDILGDNSLQLRPIFANYLRALIGGGYTIGVLDSRVYFCGQELGTSDFMIHHIHAFTIHVTLLIIAKGILNARGSRLISDKSSLGFRYPCDGPGRGGTCQVSPWDHVFLSLFWAYNGVSVSVFHFYWKSQADVWGYFEESKGVVSHLTGGDFSSSSNTINSWLTSFLWSQASQVIQGYASPVGGYTLIFLASHFVWALSLMFLYSGRGYWQEFIEAIVWAHTKLHLVPSVQPRALSITQGRAVGVTHYLLGGIATTWSFILSRIIAITT